MTTFELQTKLQKDFGNEIIIINVLNDGYRCTYLNGGNCKEDDTKYLKIGHLQRYSKVFNRYSKTCPVFTVSHRGTDASDAVVQKIR